MISVSHVLATDDAVSSLIKGQFRSLLKAFSSGLWSEVEPTLPIPNRVLKLLSADNNDLATDCEDRSRPELSAFFMSIFVPRETL